ncbi:RMI2 protein, partial [Bucco capensis]|nr:RMI2 protein [Bucco capensis]
GTWRLCRAEAGQGPVPLRVVWMQGTVLDVERGGARGGSARLQDGSGPFTVLGVDGVPKGRPCLSAGKYVMVMGVVRSCSPEPVLRAIKMTDLSENPVHQSMWSLEVEDLHRVI